MEKEEKIVDRGECYEEYKKYFLNLFSNANREDGFSYMCTLLRVSGSSYGHWDPFVEADEALKDFSKILQRESKKGNDRLNFRLGLLIYCHATEMAAPYEILGNLIRCIQKKPFQFDPFFHLRQKFKKDPFKHKLPSPRKKISFIEEEVKKIGEEKLTEMIHSFYDDELRNAFYHSDYCITEEEFRIAAGVGRSIPLTEVANMLVRCFAFYEAFFNVYREAKRMLHKNDKKIFKIKDYDTLELLTNRKDGLYGFKIHHSNGSASEYQRTNDKSHILNMSIENEGLSLFVGELDKLEKNWKRNGKLHYFQRIKYNKDGYWKPIVYGMDPDILMKDVLKFANDEQIQDCLFYILATQCLAVEFIIKSNKKLDTERMNNNNIGIIPCFEEDTCCLYDGFIFLKNKKLKSIQEALGEISELVKKESEKGNEIKYKLKYSIRYQGKIDGNKLVMSVDDPRSFMLVSVEEPLKRFNWKIKKEWLDNI